MSVIFRRRKSEKICATCEYWQGMRQIRKSDPNTIEFEEIGICNAFHSVHRGKERKGYNLYCSEYQTWYYLR